MRAAAARPRRPDCCQPKSGVPTPEGSTGGPMKAKLRAGQKTAGGHSPRTPQGETPQRGKQHTGKPTRQHTPRRKSSKRGPRRNVAVERSWDSRVKKHRRSVVRRGNTRSTPHCKPPKRLHRRGRANTLPTPHCNSHCKPLKRLHRRAIRYPLASSATGAARASESSCEGACQMASDSSIAFLLDHGITPWDPSCRAFQMNSILSGCESGSLSSRSWSWA